MANFFDGWDEADFTRLLSNFEQGGPDECWLWTGRIANGYPVLSTQGVAKAGAALVYEYLVGIPKSQSKIRLRSICKNKSCVNPAHRRPLTVRKKNPNRSTPRKPIGPVKRRKDRCSQGHDLTIEGARHKGGGCRLCRRIRAREHWRANRDKMKTYAREHGRKKTETWAQRAEEYLNSL